MAGKLQCEICGGKLVGRPGGIFECDNCGTEYSTEWAKAKIQEITGTVKVEGTVEVTGKVQVDGGTVQVDSTANKEALLQRGNLALEDEEWDKAMQLFDKELELDAECAEAYLGLAMAAARAKSVEEFRVCYSEPYSSWKEDKNVLRAKKYGGKALQDLFNSMDKQALEKIDQHKKELETIRSSLKSARSIISAGSFHTVAVKTDGTVLATGLNRSGQCNVSSWKNVVAVSAGGATTVGLKDDGTAVATGDNEYGQCNVTEWRELVEVSVGDKITAGLKNDGTVICTSTDQELQEEISKWKDIIDICTGEHFILGLRRDRTVLCAPPATKPGTAYYDFVPVISGWRDVVALRARTDEVAAIKADGTIVFASVIGDLRLQNTKAKEVAKKWTDIIDLSIGNACIIGLKANKTLLTAGENTDGQLAVGNQKSMAAICANGGSIFSSHIVGVNLFGKVIATGTNTSNECNVKNWKLFNRYDSIEAERKAIAERAEAERRAAAERAEAERRASIEDLNKEKSEKEARKAALEQELPTLTGIFKAGKRKEAEAELARINARLEKITSELKWLGG